MSMFLAFLFLAIPLLSSAQTNFERLQSLKELKRISFGSCNDQSDDQPLWEDLLKQKPDLWIWGGDNIYADWMPGGNIQKAYEFQNKNPRYHLFKKQTPIIGTWDDHDFAFNNSSGSYSGKKESQQLHLDFLEVPKDSPLRTQEGIYASHEFGEENHKIKVILLDNRYFKGLDPLYPMLGKTQWDWLETQLTNSTAKIHLITTGLPVTSPIIPYTEEWAETSELHRMLELIRKTKPKGVIFLTGDKHFSAIYKRFGQLEFLSSGMTHVAPRKTWFYLAKQYPKTYFGLSYGQIDISWEADVPVINMSMRTEDGRDVHASKYKWQGEEWAGI